MNGQSKILYLDLQHNSLSYEYHFHLHYELLYVSEGSVSVYIGGKCLQLSAGHLCTIASLVPHKTVYDNARVKRIIFSDSYISDHLSPEAVKTFPERLETTVTVSADSDNSEIIRTICRDIDYGGKSAYIYLYKLFRLCAPVSGQMPGSKNEQITKILSYIGINSKKKLSLDEIAAQCHITKYHICRLLKKEMGITPVEYITFAKIRRAVTKLLKTKNTIAQISGELSFSSPKYFTRIFKDYFDISPQKFRNTLNYTEKERYYLRGAKEGEN